ncbi:MFS superfamily sulfate permease-like transporter [Herbaspirillum rubrisubalbicans]|nr:MFS superfamily sulfate permease-like transporter [Herbaspirillum rubrisubalbicans]
MTTIATPPSRPRELRQNVLAGLTTSFALVPECIAFALVAQLNPLMGLYGAFFICTITALFGGRPGMISGAAGSMAVVIVALVVQHGAQYFLATVVLSGLIMLAFGALRLGKLVRMVPHPVMLGFVNGLAIVIALSQLEHFRLHTDSGLHWLLGSALLIMIGLTLATMLIVWLLPRVTKAIPPALAAILTVGPGHLRQRPAYPYPGRHGADSRRLATLALAQRAAEPGDLAHRRSLCGIDGHRRPAGNAADLQSHR